jgi:hypothetical protein
MDDNQDARRDAEAGPIVVHQTPAGWQVDYGSYAQGYHPTRDEATQAAVEAAKHEGRRVEIRTAADASAADRERISDERDRVADVREAIADERDRVADERDEDLEREHAPSQNGGSAAKLD